MCPFSNQIIESVRHEIISQTNTTITILLEDLMKWKNYMETKYTAVKDPRYKDGISTCQDFILELDFCTIMHCTRLVSSSDNFSNLLMHKEFADEIRKISDKCLNMSKFFPTYDSDIPLTMLL